MLCVECNSRIPLILSSSFSLLLLSHHMISAIAIPFHIFVTIQLKACEHCHAGFCLERNMIQHIVCVQYTLLTCSKLFDFCLFFFTNSFLFVSYVADRFCDWWPGYFQFLFDKCILSQSNSSCALRFLC